MAISSKIDEILASRSAKAERLKQHKTELAAVRMELIKNQKAIYEQVERIDDPELRKKYEDIVDGIDITDVIGDLDGTCKLYDDGIKRFQRDYISIATIGKEGQGKSRLLQAIGNLSGQIIPSGDAGSCTGATSIVWNDPTLSPGRVRCKITFRQHEALIEVIKPYIQTLEPDYLNDHEIRFEAIGAINVNRLYRSGDQADAFRSSAKAHLEKIVDNFSEIRDLFGDIPRILEDPNEIQTFVAQNNSLPADDHTLTDTHFRAYRNEDIKLFTIRINRERASASMRRLIDFAVSTGGFDTQIKPNANGTVDVDDMLEAFRNAFQATTETEVEVVTNYTDNLLIRTEHVGIRYHLLRTAALMAICILFGIGYFGKITPGNLIWNAGFGLTLSILAAVWGFEISLRAAAVLSAVLVVPAYVTFNIPEGDGIRV